MIFHFGDDEIDLLDGTPSDVTVDMERITFAIATQLPTWIVRDVPAIWYAVSIEWKVCVFVLDIVDTYKIPEQSRSDPEQMVTKIGRKLTATLVDYIALSDVDTETDPRMIPARIGNKSFGAAQNPVWDLITLLCAFDLINRTYKKGKTTYRLWEALDVEVMDYPEHALVVVSDIIAPPIYKEEGLLL